jgi:hypothetical protein
MKKERSTKERRREREERGERGKTESERIKGNVGRKEGFWLTKVVK